jgi:uncharacterized protein YbbC (DUF1343 family)
MHRVGVQRVGKGGTNAARRRALALALPLSTAALIACVTGASGGAGDDDRARSGRVQPGIEVLLGDSIGLIRGKRVGLLTNQTGVDRRGESDIELLRADRRAKAAGVRLVSLFSPEHGIRGTEDREHIASGRDQRSGLPIHSLYAASTIAPPDSTLRGLDAIVFDLQDVGTRTWTYVGALVYTMRAAKRNGVRVIVLDRPNPLSGDAENGPMLDSAIANPNESAPGRLALAYALYPFPLRHGMTMGEMARFYNEELGIGGDLVVVPMRRWRRDMWFDDTGLPWVHPSPNLPTLVSATVYPALVGLEASNVSVGRGTPESFQQFGAPWLDARRTAGMLNERGLPGVRFEPTTFTPRRPGDGKYADRAIPGVRVVVAARNRFHAGRVGAAILWALARSAGDSLRVDARAFDLRFGSPSAREALMRGEDPDAVIDRSLPEVVAFHERARRYYLYK